jgi:Ser/Thr protein kinase RdoA (MazF antagonist)
MSPLPVRRSLIAPDALAQLICTHYALNQPVRCQVFAHSHDDLYRVEASSNTFVCRVFATGNRRNEIAAQALILETMILAGLSVAHPIAGTNGYVLDVPVPEGMRHALLYCHSTGVSAGERITPEQASTYGHLVARIHEVADAQSRLVIIDRNRTFCLSERLYSSCLSYINAHTSDRTTVVVHDACTVRP